MECTKRDLITRISTFCPLYSDHTCFDHLSRETYAKHSIGTKAFRPSIIVAHTPYIWLLLVSQIKAAWGLMWTCYSNAIHGKTLNVSMLTPTKLPGPSCPLLFPNSRVGSFTSHKDRNNRALRPVVPTVYHSYQRRLECLAILYSITKKRVTILSRFL